MRHSNGRGVPAEESELRTSPVINRIRPRREAQAYRIAYSCEHAARIFRSTKRRIRW
jgi:hypothetical protein